MPSDPTAPDSGNQSRRIPAHHGDSPPAAPARPTRSTDPTDPTGVTDFDEHTPVVIESISGHAAAVYRDPARDDGRVPFIVLTFDGTPYVLRPARAYDTRETILEAALPLARILAEPDL